MIKSYYFLTSETSLALKPNAADLLTQSNPALNAALLSTAIVDAIPDRPPTLSGVLELWYESASDVGTAFPAEIFEGEVEASEPLTGIERCVMRQPNFYSSGGVKGIYAFRKKEGMSVADFQHYWWQNHGPVAALTENATCYVQCHVLKDAYESAEPAYDGVTELYWPSVPDALAALGSRQMTEDQSDDAKKFVTLDSVELMIAQQHMIISPWKEVI